MGLFNKKSTSKIPAPSEQGYGQQGYGQPQQQQPYAQQAYGAGAGAGAGFQQRGGPGAAYNQQPDPYASRGASGAPGGYGQQQPQPYQDRFPGAKPPSAGFGQGYDRYGGGGGSSVNRVPQDELEAEYGAGSKARQGGGGAGYGYDQAQTYDQRQEEEEQQGERNEEDDEVEAIKQQMRFTKQESLSSTRNALRIARETEETARGTLLKLGEQSDKLANTERHLDISKAHSSRAEDNAKQIVALNRSIFRPNMQLNKKGKRDAEELRIINRHVEEREEREAVRAEALKVQNRLDQELGGPGSGRFGGRFGADRFGKGSKELSAEQVKKNKLAERSRYQFEATGSDDELEDELDSNLDEISDLAGRLNRLGKAMGTEIDEQNGRIRRLGDKTTQLDTKIYAGTERLNRIK